MQGHVPSSDDDDEVEQEVDPAHFANMYYDSNNDSLDSTANDKQ